MDKEELSLIGFEIVAYAGEARSKLLEAINSAKDGDFEKAEELIKASEQTINKAHNIQTEMLTKDAAGDAIELNLILVHGQDHLMTTLLLKDLVYHLIALYKKG